MFYYTVNGKKFFNPYLAWYENFQTKAPIEFHVKDLEYSTINWTQEPLESFDVLMDRHAKNLRNKYERLIFFWSGGTDSQTVLNVFARNRIPIDEIVYIGNRRIPWYSTKHLDWLKQNYWDKTVKITHHDILNWKKRSEIVKDETWAVQDFGDTRSFDLGGLDLQSHDYCAANHGAYRWALLSGHEKPKLKYKNGTWWTAVEDRPVRQIIGLTNVEPFFLNPILHLKQSHLLANTMNQLPIQFQDSDDAEDFLSPRVNGKVDRHNYLMFAAACGRHPELTTGVSAAQKNKIVQYGAAIQINLDQSMVQTVLPGANPTLVEKLKDKDTMAMNYLKGLHYIAADFGFKTHLNENALANMNSILTLKPNFSKFYNLGH